MGDTSRPRRLGAGVHTKYFYETIDSDEEAAQARDLERGLATVTPGGGGGGGGGGGSAGGGARGRGSTGG